MKPTATFPRYEVTPTERQKLMKVADTLVKSATFCQKMAAGIEGEVAFELRATALMCIATAEAMMEILHPESTALALVATMAAPR